MSGFVYMVPPVAIAHEGHVPYGTGLTPVRSQ